MSEKEQAHSDNKRAIRERPKPRQTQEQAMADEQTERATIILQARHDPRMLSADSIVALGQTCGNRCVQRLLASRAVQAKLTVNPPDDQYETEADAVADRVMKTASVQRQTSPEEKEEGQEIQTHSHHRKRLDAHEVAPLQRTPGSRAVAGLLPATNGKAILQPGGSETLDISREPEPTDVSRKEGKEGETESAESKGDQGGERKKSFDLDQWLSGKLYDLVKEQLGEDKLKEYAKKLSKAATDQLLTQVKGATSVDDFSKKIVVNEIGETLKADLNKALTDLLGSADALASAAPPSTITMASRLAATTRSMSLCSISSKVGNAISVPSTRPTASPQTSARPPSRNASGCTRSVSGR